MKIPGVFAPLLLLVGTVGLLLNEFFLHWGRVATLSFAAFGAIGLLWFTSILMRERSSVSTVGDE